MYQLHTPPPMEDPTLIFGMAGWGDAASAASDAADWLVEDSQPVVTFDPDAVFDYRSNRPVIRFSGGDVASVTWPRLEIRHVAPSGRDVLALVGNEPDFAWAEICDTLVDLAGRFGVEKVITLGSVPTPIRHSPEGTVFCSASDSRMLLAGDEVLMDQFVVPASAGSVFRSAVVEAGFPSIGYWAQVPQYVGRPYHPAILALLRKTQAQLGIELELDAIINDVGQQMARLDEILERRDDARAFVDGLELRVGNTAKFPDELPTADEIADEVAQYLRDSEGGDGF